MNHTSCVIVVSFSSNSNFDYRFSTYNFLNICLEIQDMKLRKGLALQDILTELHLFVNKSMPLTYKFHKKCKKDISLIVSF